MPYGEGKRRRALLNPLVPVPKRWLAIHPDLVAESIRYRQLAALSACELSPF